MYEINRTIAIIKPKQPYLDWARTVSDPIDISLKELRHDCTAVLLPDVSDDAQTEVIVAMLAPELFAIELAAWDVQEDAWPAPRDAATFRAWFDVELHSIVLDSVEAPIRRERYAID
jgi:hypothetical protein